jgi:hypothetical protein
MRLYRIGYPGAIPKLVELDTENGYLEEILIGQQGRGRKRVIIPLTGTGSEVCARKTDEGIVLVRGNWPVENRCLVIINTVGAYDRIRSYGLYDSQGIQKLACGIIAFGDAGRVNGGEELLAILIKDAEFRLNSKYSSVWYKWNGKEWIVESPEKRKSRMALKQVEQGGGEWL